MSVTNKLSQKEKILTLRYNQNNCTISCPNCKSEVLYYDDYCYNCGTQLSDSKRKKIEEITNINKELLLKYSGVCLINAMINDPFLFQKVRGEMKDYRPLVLDYLLVHFKPMTVYEVMDYLLSEGYVVMLEGEEKYKSYFSHCNEDYICYLLEEYNIQQTSSKEGNILFLINKVPQDVLEKITSNGIIDNRGSNYFEVTDTGKKLVENNIKCLIYDEIFYDFNLEYFDNKVNETVNEKDLIQLLDESTSDTIKNFKWQSYSDLLYKTAEVYDKFDNMNNMLYYLIQHVICEFNPYANNSIKTRIYIDEHLKNKVIYALSISNKDYEELTDIIHTAYNDLKLPKNFISEENVGLLLEELLIVPEVRIVNKHLILNYGFERIEEELIFDNKYEQEKIINKLEQYST